MGTFARGVKREDRVLASKLIRAMRPGMSLDIPEPTYSSKLPGDTLALRGIPAIGRGVAGAIPGTKPGVIRRLRLKSRTEDQAA